MKLDDLLALSVEMSFHPTDGGAVIYDATNKRLFALNDTAAFVWLAVCEGASREAMKGELGTAFNLPAEEAERWIELALASLDQTLLSEPPEPSSQPDAAVAPIVSTEHAGTDYTLLGQIARISAPAAAIGLIDSMIGHLKRSESDHASDIAAVSILVEADGPNFVVSGGCDPTVFIEPERLVAEIERRIVQDVVPRIPHLLAFHAALLHVGARAVLFPAPSGSGKTTLSVTLARQGWSYRTDEMALLGRDLAWQGLPFPPCIKATSYPSIEPIHPGLRDVIEHDRFGRRVKFLPVPVGSGRLAVSTVVFPRYETQAEGRLQPLQSLEGLRRLLTQCVYVPAGFSRADVPTLLQWHNQAKYYEIALCSPEQVIAALGESP